MGDHKDVDKKEEMSTQFNHSISLVRDYTSRIERDYARPAIRSSRVVFEERPVVATFAAIFGSLSLLPVVSFLGFSLFTVITFTAIAVGGATAASAAVVLAFFAILASILTAAFFTSILLTVLAISFFILFRLAVLVRQEGLSGISIWAGESKRHFVNATKGGQQNDSSILLPGDTRSESSNDSPVLVQAEPENRAAGEGDDKSFGEGGVMVQG